MEAVRQPRCTVDVEVPADRISTVGLQCIKRIYCISFGFAHLLTVLILNMSEHDNILIRALVEEQGRFCHQRIEPSTGLVNSLGNKLSRELLLKQVFVLKRIMMLSKWHCS